MTLYLEAFLLSLASSTDNFMVGLSVGIGNRSLSFGVNALISGCNAAGAWLAALRGSTLGQVLPPFVSPLLSAFAFGVLALREFWEFHQTFQSKNSSPAATDDAFTANNAGKKRGETLDIPRAMQLAIPMTLNNLAGGVAGGTIGVTPIQAGIFGLFASFLTMATGHFVGLHLVKFSRKDHLRQKLRHSTDNGNDNTYASKWRLLLNPSIASGILLGILCVMSIQELLAI